MHKVEDYRNIRQLAPINIVQLQKVSSILRIMAFSSADQPIDKHCILDRVDDD